MSNEVPVEIERKYVIRMPNVRKLAKQEDYTVSEIRQTYLESSLALTHRVRMRTYSDRVVYTETKKIRIDSMSAYEVEREICQSEYLRLLENIKSGTHTVLKKRHTFTVSGQTFEVDVYPEWERSCILETELPSRDKEVVMPPFISVIREVTGERKYSNASMSQEFPEELI